VNFPRRVIFGANASGVAAHIRRPENKILKVQAASSLPVTGGLSESKAGPGGLEDYLQYQSAETSAHGDYIDEKAAEAMTRGKVPFDAVQAKSTVTAKVRGLHVGRRLMIRIADAGMVAYSPMDGAKQPAIHLSGNRLEGVRIDNSALRITLNESIFCEYDTLEKLSNAFPKFSDPHAGMFVNPNGSERCKALPISNGMVACTIVEKMEWEGRPHPEATIDGNLLIVPEFGKVYFGGMLLSENSRRLTMVRIQLGSPEGGEISASEVEDPVVNWPA